MTNVAIIGAGFGDEGKGRTVEYVVNKLLRAGEKPIVIRYNGGAQAGHTVQLADGTRHVFSHFGSGTLMDVPTYLSEYFIVEPGRFLNEYAVLKTKMDTNPKVAIHANALLTTPWDIYLNRAKEESRGSFAHGSVGAGINETITRNVQVRLRVSDYIMMPFTEFYKALQKIQHNFALSCQELGCNTGEKYEEMIHEDAINNFFKCLELFYKYVDIIPPHNIKPMLAHYSLVFEGAQGLMLDEHFGEFPHVTRSRTCSINVTNIMRDLGRELDETIYVTRCYATRHGNGPFSNTPFEEGQMNIVDPTNEPNKWQGSMRFGRLNISQLTKFIKMDEVYCSSKVRSLSVTCLDQAVDGFYLDPPNTNKMCEYMFMHSLHWGVQMNKYYVTKGPTVNDVIEYDWKVESDKYDKSVDKKK